MSSDQFEAGRLIYFLDNWKKLTTDHSVLDIVQNCHIEFLKGANPVKTSYNERRFPQKENTIIDQEIQKLLSMKVIKEVKHDLNEFISPIFVIPKKDGDYRMILNLKELNEFIAYRHFKMEHFETVLKLVKPGTFFASIDIRHAYYSIFIAPEHQVKLRFMKSGKVYQYQALPNGISCAPKQFTRLMKPVYASLHMLGHTLSGYIDDSILMGDTFTECENNVLDTVNLMTEVGFIIHENKSVFIPTQRITFLGNDIDSVAMIVSLPANKVAKLVQACIELYNKEIEVIRQVARVLGLMVSSFSAVQFGPLHYREIERAKILALHENAGDYDSNMLVTSEMREELIWWIDYLPSQKRDICHGNAKKVITCDASGSGWGAVCEDIEIGGRWSSTEVNYHINYLELLAICHAVQSFCKFDKDTHVQVRSDNTCAVSYIRNMGGKIEILNSVTKQIWQWCITKNIWLSATYIPGVLNEADSLSREFDDSTEWMLNKSLFNAIVKEFGLPDIDMFASRLNKQVHNFVSWKPDPDAMAIDAFSIKWPEKLIYAFPPFSIIGRVVQKVHLDKAEVVLVAPIWITQNWYTAVLQMLVRDPLILKVMDKTLRIPQSDKVHSLVNKLHLMVCRISGDPSKTEIYQANLLKSSWHRGDPPLRSNMPHILTDGFSSVLKGKKIFFKPLLM